MLSFDEVMKVRRLEKSASRLVRVEPSFYTELEELIQEEVKNLDPVSLKDVRELDNLKNAVSDIYNMREKKILSQALLASRTGSADTDHMVESEQEMYDQVLQLLKPFRDNILIAFGKKPSKQPAQEPTPPEPTPEPVQEPEPAAEPTLVPETPQPEPVPPSTETVSSPIEAVQQTIVPQEQSFNNVPLLILENVPNFVGEDMSEYGPYEKGRRVELPTKVANLLTSRNLAKAV